MIIRRYWKHFASLILLLAAISVAALWFTYWTIGRTPGELLDYADKRLQGHPGLQAAALPVTALLRDWFDAPSPADRQRQSFAIPPPPPLLLANDTITPAVSLAAQAPGRTLRVGPQEAIRSIAAAARLARDGDIVEIQAGEYHADVASWPQKKLAIRGVGGNARLFAGGRSAEGKAIWVIRNGDFDIANIDFIGARVHDRNGAGIRFENGHLRVSNCLFWGNENGILTGGGKDQRHAVLEIENSEFAYNGIGDGQSHNLYVGAIGILKIRGSYLHHANAGHLIKSRAAHNEITYNRLTDESGGRASYELEFPNGGIALVIGNIIQQNRQTENSSMISFGAEQYAWPENRLYLASNTLVNDHPHGGTFLRVAPGVTGVVSANNLLAGRGRYHVSANLATFNDHHVDWEVFSQASRHDYRLAGDGRKLAYQAAPFRTANGLELQPQAEYSHPRQLRSLDGKPGHPGALQTGYR